VAQIIYYETTEALETIRTQEIAALTEERASQIIDSLEVPEEAHAHSDGSGLVQQQDLFRKRKWK
jgi:hypothetical protein